MCVCVCVRLFDNINGTQYLPSIFACQVQATIVAAAALGLMYARALCYFVHTGFSRPAVIFWYSNRSINRTREPSPWPRVAAVNIGSSPAPETLFFTVRLVYIHIHLRICLNGNFLIRIFLLLLLLSRLIARNPSAPVMWRISMTTHSSSDENIRRS